MRAMRRAGVEGALIGLTAALLLAGAGAAALDVGSIPPGFDFAAYYLAAQALDAGRSPYDLGVLRELAAGQGGVAHTAYFYPPAFAAALRPLARLPFAAANMIWLGLSLGCYGLALRWLGRLLEVPARLAPGLLLAALLAPGLVVTLALGQVNTMLLLLIVAGWAASARRAGGAIGGGLWLGVAGLVKIFPLALLAGPLQRGRRRELLGAAIGAAALVGLGLAAGGGAQLTLVWLTEVLPAIAGGFTTPHNQSLLSAAQRLGEAISVRPLALFGAPERLVIRPLAEAPGAARLLGYGLCAAVGLATLGALWRGRGDGPARARLDLALLLSMALLVTPIVWSHYYVLLLVPVGVGLRDGWGDQAARRLILAGCALAAAQQLWRLTALAGSPLLLSLGTLGVLLIWAGLARLQLWAG